MRPSRARRLTISSGRVAFRPLAPASPNAAGRESSAGFNSALFYHADNSLTPGDDLWRLALRVANVPGTEQLVQDDGAQGAEAEVVERQRQTAEVDRNGLRGGDAGRDDQGDRRHGQVGPLGEVHLGVDPDLAADDRDQAEEVHLDAALHADRDAANESAEDRDEAEKDREDRRDDENHDREDAGYAHDADVLRVGRLTGAAQEAADRRPQAVANERATEHGAQVALHDSADRVHMARVLGDEDHRDEEEQAQLGAELAEIGKAERRESKDRGAADRAEVDVACRLGAGARRIDGGHDVADHDPDQDRKQAGKAAQIDGGANRG